MKSRHLTLICLAVATGLGLSFLAVFRMGTDASAQDKPSQVPGSSSRKEGRLDGSKDQVLAGLHQTAQSTRNTSSNALRKFLELKSRANQGDAAAQRDLAEAYGRCIAVSGNPQKFLSTYEAIAKQSNSPSNAKGMLQAATAYVEECSIVDNGAVVPLEARNLWLEQAAKGGDLAAQARLQMASPDRPNGEALRSFIDKVATADDPLATFELGQLVAGNSDVTSLGSYADVASGPVSGYAWSIAACQMGLDCGAGSELMNSVCLNTSGCSSPNFESFVRNNLVSVGDAALLDRKVEKIKIILNKS
ncbi:sel1 repeat family protein [Xanthomonas oryzae]|uniref:Sel1 repeat family protein n=1 Tax=Xanthomonas oryzae pv. leersiae TaxID=3112258 RepID=A0AAJ6KMV9_9XANT|nr:sel1 repeat family protein [Xanthomonas oryzae]QBG88568.1 sel1 repeat family protein [Xanthomonas oryzae]QBG95690.1 sel1 repeat family protein [Xanthomonas oryzae]QBH04102.1 sel1 repeat family protein [Xanthomonas oryzae]WIX08158.1 sel1 repeat family protein [Xanthomonas oryzae pv. oryzae]